MADNKVMFRKGSLNTIPSTRDADTLYFASDKGILFLGQQRISDIVKVTSAPTVADALTNRLYVSDDKVYFLGKKALDVGGSEDHIYCLDAAGIANEIANLLGKSTDTSAQLTIYGTRKLAQEEAAAVLGTASDTSASETVKGARLLADEKVASVTAGDDSVTIAGTDTDPTVAVQISSIEGNALSLETVEGKKGLKVIIPSVDSYKVEEAASAEAGYLKTYVLNRYAGGDETGTPAEVGKINIPKDFLVKSGEVKTVATADQPYEGAKVGDKYIDFVINVKSGSATDEHIYLPVNDLVDVYTSGSAAGDMVVITIGNDNKITAAITAGTITETELHADVVEKLGKAHTHDNKALLDTYTQTEDDLADAVSKAHAHAANSKDIVTIDGDLSYDADDKKLSYSHPTTTAVGADFVKVGKDDKGHVVLGAAIVKGDLTTLLDADDGTYDAIGAADAVLGKSTDSKDTMTVNGVKNYVNDRLTWDVWDA